MAGVTVANKIFAVIFAVLVGYGQGFAPVCGVAYGAGLESRVKRSLRFTMITTVIFMCAMGAATWVLVSEVAGVFLHEGGTQAMQLAALSLRAHAISMPFAAVCLVTGMYYQALGAYGKATLISALRQGVCFIPMVFILPHMYGVDGVAFVQAAADVLAVTMPCFGTTKRTRSNAEILCDELQVSFKEIDIANTVHSHFADIGQDESVLDVTFENGQARVRTLELMDTANRTGGLVVGTGDLSELALGWATYNGDHMSMYGVNAGVPKTLVRHLVRYEADIAATDALRTVLLDILDTPVSPELLPAKDGEISQKTDDLVGPYELHDFYLYYVLRFGFGPAKIFRLAKAAFAGRAEYPDEVLYRWLRNFYWRFFAQQFKRSCLPDGPKVGSVTLSPRGDWRLPSDAAAALWLAELEQIPLKG